MYNKFDSDNFMIPQDSIQEIKNERRYMSKFFFILIGSYTVSYAIIASVLALLPFFNLSIHSVKKIEIVLSCILTPAFLGFAFLFGRNIKPEKHPATAEMTVLKFVSIMLASFFVLIIGSALGTVINSSISKITGNEIGNVVADSIADMELYEIFISAVIIAPVFEELVFRKFLIDRLSRYGTSFCVTVSGLVFGLMHGNFTQFFYAFGLGAIFAYVYCVYGKIIYPVLMHAIVNAFGSIVPAVLKVGETDYLTTAQSLYLTIYMILFLVGSIVFWTGKNKTRFYMVGGRLINPGKAIIGSTGFIVTVVIMSLSFLISVLA